MKKTALLLLVVLLFSGCNMMRIAGMADSFPLDEEPRIIVDLPDGGEESMLLEEYVAGVVAGEMKPDWHPNAYAAQAIIARTFALAYLEENDTDTISGDFAEAQAFKPEQVTPVIRDAVARTRGQVVLYNGEYISAWFHSHAGGRTTSAQVGLDYQDDEPPYVQSVSSPDFIAPDNVNNWQVSFTQEEIMEAVKSVSGDAVGTVERIVPVNINVCGRPEQLRIEGSAGSTVVSAPNFRNEIGSEELKSTMFAEIARQEEGFIFTGTGFGHGVGLSQWGSLAMARRGNTPQDIIRYYYRGIRITRLYD